MEHLFLRKTGGRNTRVSLLPKKTFFPKKRMSPRKLGRKNPRKTHEQASTRTDPLRVHKRGGKELPRRGTVPAGSPDRFLFNGQREWRFNAGGTRGRIKEISG